MKTAELIDKYNKYRNQTINMQPSENILSPAASEALKSGMASRYSLFVDNYNAYGGTEYFDEILNLLETNVKKLFKAKYSESRSLSGHIAAEISLLSILSKKKTVMAIGENDGGYPGYEQKNLGNILGYKFLKIPYSNYSIDYDQLELKVKENNPGIIILGQSEFVKNYDLKRIHEISIKYNAKLLYDGSHVMGLIAGNQFQPDALKFCDILFGSTHKTFFGPQGGLILSNSDEIYNKIEENTIFKTMDNINLSRIASLSVSVEEMLEYGNEYAAQVVKNTRTLSTELEKTGFKILPENEISQSHQILLDEKFLKNNGFDFKSFSIAMEKQGVIIDRFGRIGTQEITRSSLNDMPSIAYIISGIYNKLNRAEEIKELVSKKQLKYW